jgi:hypothetical protein
VETVGSISKPTPQEELVTLLRKLEGMSVDMRATCYRVEMLIRKCEKCLANSKEAVK